MIKSKFHVNFLKNKIRGRSKTTLPQTIKVYKEDLLAKEN